MFKKDNFKFGLLLGFLGPLFGLLLLYYLKAPSSELKVFLYNFIHSKPLLTSIGSLSLLVNVVLFTIYINGQKDRTAKGIFTLTLIYGISLLLLKLIG